MRPLLILTPPGFSDKQRALQRGFLQAAGIPTARIHWRCFHSHHNVHAQRKKNDRFTPPTEAEQQRILHGIIKTNPAFIIINDKAALYTLVGKRSLHLCRGSSYRVCIGPRFACDSLVFADVLTTVGGMRWSRWVWESDCRKLLRHITGRTRPQPEFEYEVIRHQDGLARFRSSASTANFLAVDIETWGAGDNSHITCVAVSCFRAGSRSPTFVLPFHTIDALPILPPAETRKALANILASPVPKVMQNGIYDTSHLLRERLVPANWWIDTAVISHSIWQEAPKTLHFLASMALDHVQYWKDETRTAETAASEIEEPYAFPRHEADVLQYWRYNALDAYYTASITPYLLAHLRILPWAAENYRKTLRQILKPALLMCMSGCAINDSIRQRIIQNSTTAATEELYKLQQMTACKDFNPKSVPQVQQLVYDILRAQPLPRKGRSTREDILKMVQPQSPLIDIIIEQIWKAKKPAGVVSKYGSSLRLQRGRLYYSLSPTGTTSFRYSSKESNYHTGTQVQNINKDGPLRAMIEADPGYILVERDYEQSDAYFTAYSAAEQKFIGDLQALQDTHCLNASRFFRRPYDSIYRGYRADEDWVVHSTRGIRQITKRIVYGANYRMAAYTLFIQMGHRSVVSAARSLGYQAAHSWPVNRLIEFCDSLLRTYFDEIYPGLEPWLQHQIRRAASDGNKATCIGDYTRIFFGDLRNDQKIQREFAAFYGQTGTAANINRSLERICYERDKEGNTWLDRGGRLLFQVHDSILCQVPQGHLELIDELGDLMDNPRAAPSGDIFRVPGETKVGRGWGKRMVRWVPGQTTIQEIDDHDKAWQERFFASATV